MALFEQIDRDLVTARKQRDRMALDTLGLLKSEVVKAGKEPAAGGSPDDDLLLRIIRRHVAHRPRPWGGRQRGSLTGERLRDISRGFTELETRNAVQMTIATIVPAQTSDGSVNSVNPRLFARSPAAADLAAADPAEVEAIIK